MIATLCFFDLATIQNFLWILVWDQHVHYHDYLCEVNSRVSALSSDIFDLKSWLSTLTSNNGKLWGPIGIVYIIFDRLLHSIWLPERLICSFYERGGKSCPCAMLELMKFLKTDDQARMKPFMSRLVFLSLIFKSMFVVKALRQSICTKM